VDAASLTMVVSILVFFFVVIVVRRRKKVNALEGLAAAIGGTVDISGSAVRVTRHGVATAIRFVTRGTGSNTVPWTHIECDLPPGYPLALNIRRHGGSDQRRIERSEMVDVELGDPEFDAAFVVEGAPADVVRQMLPEEVRSFLLLRGGLEVATDGGVLRLAIAERVDAPDAVTMVVDWTSRLAASLVDATATADAAVAAGQAPGGDPYRPRVDDRPLREARAARAAEVAAVEARRTEHARRARWIAAATVGAVIVAVAVIAVAVVAATR
jgi:hypothetical protein